MKEGEVIKLHENVITEGTLSAKLEDVNKKFAAAKEKLGQLEAVKENLSKEILWLQGEHRALTALVKEAKEEKPNGK